MSSLRDVKDDLLKLYRKRYKDLASQASHTRPTSKSNV